MGFPKTLHTNKDASSYGWDLRGWQHRKVVPRQYDDSPHPRTTSRVLVAPSCNCACSCLLPWLHEVIFKATAMEGNSLSPGDLEVMRCPACGLGWISSVLLTHLPSAHYSQGKESLFPTSGWDMTWRLWLLSLSCNLDDH